MLLKKVISIDLGTNGVRCYLKGKGIVVDEPAIVAVNNRTNKMVAVGRSAKTMLDRTPSHINALRPINHGVIADFDMAKEMMRVFLRRSVFPWSFFTDIVATVPTNLTEVERKSVVDLFKENGASRVYLLEQPLAAAFSNRLDIYRPTAYLIVDIGAGTTDMAIMSMNGIVVSKRLKVAGDYFNHEIIKGVREELQMYIGEPTAEDIKLAVGSAIPLTGERLDITVRGRDVASGLPREVVVKDTIVRSWISPGLKNIEDALHDLIEVTPPELVGDIYKNGIYLCGGGSLLRGIDELFKKNIGVGVTIMDEPLTCVVRGSGMIAENLSDHKHLVDTAVVLGDPRT